MNNKFCSACKNKLSKLGKIPDGILFKCNSCGSKKIYIENFEKFKNENGYGNAYRAKFDSNKTSKLVEIFNNDYHMPTKAVELLDIGFGTGEFLYEMKKKDFLVTGLDCDENAVKNISANGITAFNGELGAQLKLQQKFDVITLWDVFEHINDIELAMQQLNRLTKTNGKLFIITPNAKSIFDLAANLERYFTFYKSQRIMNICLNRYHLHRFSIDGLRSIFERFGYSIKTIKSIQLFSLSPDEYTNGFAPGILKWTNNSSFNKFFSRTIMLILKVLRLRNKIYVVAEKK